MSRKQFLVFLCFTFSWLRRLVPTNTIRVIQTNINPRFIDPLQCLLNNNDTKMGVPLKTPTWRSLFDPHPPASQFSLRPLATVSNRKATGLGTSGNKKEHLKKEHTNLMNTTENRPFQKETSLPTIHFQVRAVSFREVSSPDINSRYRKKNSNDGHFLRIRFGSTPTRHAGCQSWPGVSANPSGSGIPIPTWAVIKTRDQWHVIRLVGKKGIQKIYHLESRWRNPHVLVYHGPLPIHLLGVEPSTFTTV